MICCLGDEPSILTDWGRTYTDWQNTMYAIVELGNRETPAFSPQTAQETEGYAAYLKAMYLTAEGNPSAEAAPETQTENGAVTEAQAEADALKEALEAYAKAKAESRVQSVLDALKEELDALVAAGKLTQEQADLILKYYNEQQSLRNGTCPNCGYAFQNNGGFGKGGRMGGKGGRGHGGRGGFGGMNGFGQMPSQGQLPGTTPDAGSANGTAFEPEWDFEMDEATVGGI